MTQIPPRPVTTLGDVEAGDDVLCESNVPSAFVSSSTVDLVGAAHVIRRRVGTAL